MFLHRLWETSDSDDMCKISSTKFISNVSLKLSEI